MGLELGDNNYVYDKSGNLIESVKDGTIITWNAYGKVDRIDKGADFTKFGYDSAQNRVMKSVFNSITNSTESTFYVRDATGNVLSVYKHTESGGITDVEWSEAHMYASKRIGIVEVDETTSDAVINQAIPIRTQFHTSYVGAKRYELSNHLGNVLTVVNDRKKENITGNTVNSFEPTIISSNDYYPFGLEMEDRSYTCLLYTSPSPRDGLLSRMPSSA